MSERSSARRTARVTVSALTLFTALGIAGCAPRAEEAPAPAAPAPTLDFPVGARVEVQRFGKWFPATVLVSNAGKWKIHYEGFGAEWDELVGTDRIRAVMPTFPVGEKVLVQMANRVALAEVAAQIDPLHWRVHYDGYGPEVGEVVGPDRLRRPYSGVVTHPVGEPVGVDINGHVFSGKIIALASADHMLVRFPTFGPDYDQEIGPERLRPVPAAAEAPLAPAAAPALAAAAPAPAPPHQDPPRTRARPPRPPPARSPLAPSPRESRCSSRSASAGSPLPCTLRAAPVCGRSTTTARPPATRTSPKTA